MSGYLTEPIRDNEDFKGAVRNVQNGPKQPNACFSKEMAVLTHFFKGYGRDSSCSLLIKCQGTLWNQSETMKTSKEPSGKSKRARRAKTAKRGIFKGDGIKLPHAEKGSS